MNLNQEIDSKQVVRKLTYVRCIDIFLQNVYVGALIRLRLLLLIVRVASAWAVLAEPVLA